MGKYVKLIDFPMTTHVSCLVIFTNVIMASTNSIYSMNKELAERLIRIKPERRTLQLEKCFISLLNAHPEVSIIKDIDVMFNPAYKIDVMKLLSSAYNRRQFSLVWPGIYADGKLIYSEEGYSDYRVYEIKDYDIMCVI